MIVTLSSYNNFDLFSACTKGWVTFHTQYDDDSVTEYNFFCQNFFEWYPFVIVIFDTHLLLESNSSFLLHNQFP